MLPPRPLRKDQLVRQTIRERKEKPCGPSSPLPPADRRTCFEAGREDQPARAGGLMQSRADPGLDLFEEPRHGK
jgi:hypothetical protein